VDASEVKVVEHGIVLGTVEAVNHKMRMDQKRNEDLLARPLHGRFFKGMKEDDKGEVIAGPKSWEWVRSGYMTKSTEAYIFTAQEQALGTRSVRSKIYSEVGEDGNCVSGMCRICGKKVETVAYIAGGCGVLMEGPGTVRHDRIGARVHWESCKKYGVKYTVDRWYKHKPHSVEKSDSGEVTLHWDVQWHSERNVLYNRPDVVLLRTRGIIFGP